MTRAATLAPEQLLTIDEFIRFYDQRPDGEKWELIEGIAVMSPTPTDFHQLIVGNITTALLTHKRNSGATWLAMPGVGTRVPISPRSLPEPDVFVKQGAITGTATTDDALVVFEVLSRSNTKADQAWRRKVYTSIPNCEHYVTVSLKAVDVTVFDRAGGWTAAQSTALTDMLALPAIGISMPLADIYRWTPLGE